MNKPVSLSIDEPLFRQLHNHIFPGDGDEHGAVIAAGIAKTGRGTRLLAREVFAARDGIDYVPGTRGYRALTGRFVAEKVGYCADRGLCYLAVHCHGGRDSVAFSDDDVASHERGYPALLQITGGGPVGALVFSREAVAGDVWAMEGRFDLNHATVIGSRIRKLYPQPPKQAGSAAIAYDRQVRLFGDIGQTILSELKVGIIGLGGGGSLLNEWLARLGVGHIVAVDPDRMDVTNLSRIPGSTRWDALAFLTERNNLFLNKIGRRFAKCKVHVARRVAKQANHRVHYEAIAGNVLDRRTANRLMDCDFLFLSSDSFQSRLLFNALVHQYLIPGIQIGAKVSANRETGEIMDVFVATRPVFPSPGFGCLQCHELISPTRLQEEALQEDERRAQKYVDDDTIVQPSVITLNVVSAAQAANDLMMIFTGLYDDSVALRHQLGFVRERIVATVEPRIDEFCPDCSCLPFSRRARGDRARLPCRQQ